MSSTVAVFRAGPQVVRVRFVMWLLVAFAVGFVGWGIDLGLTYGTHPADGGVLAPLSVRLLWLFGMSLTGIAAAVAGVVYGRKYVSRIDFDDTAKRFRIYTLTLFGSRQHLYVASEIRGARFHDGQMRGRINVNAPWWTVRVGAERLPLIIDAQGRVLDNERFRTFIR